MNPEIKNEINGLLKKALDRVYVNLGQEALTCNPENVLEVRAKYAVAEEIQQAIRAELNNV